MAEIVRMPKLSDTMTEGVIAEWHKKVGDKVAEGELLAEIESDKATMEFESFQDGVLLHIGVEKGKAAPINSILAILGEKGEDIQPLLDADAAASAKTEKEEAKEEVAEAKPAPIAEKPKPVVSEAPRAIVDAPVSSNGRVKASPLAKKLASDKGIDISLIGGSGDGGRIIKRDVEAYQPGVGFSAGSQVESFHEEEVSQMRKTIARRLAESKFSAPHFYLTMKIDMDAMMDARDSINS
ncbi:MAG: pyruvate dehydrogenase E2 component (dihydrolipoamide acetyltransferase), partial [Bacteroidia bacterium]